MISAEDTNSTDVYDLQSDASSKELTMEPDNGVGEIPNNVGDAASHQEVNTFGDNGEILKNNTPKISSNNDVATFDKSLDINLKDEDGNPIANEKVIVYIVSKNYTIKTNDEGIASLKICLIPKQYNVTAYFNGNDKYVSVNYSFKLNVVKSNPKLAYIGNTVANSNYLQISLKNALGNAICGETIIFGIVGKKYHVKTDANGIASLKICLASKKYDVTVYFYGDSKYNSVNYSFKLNVVKSNPKLAYISSTVVKSNYLQISLKNARGDVISG